MNSKSSTQTDQQKLEHLFSTAKEWCVNWGLSRLMRDVQIVFSHDTSAALGRLDLKTMTITLNAVLLLEANEPLLFETLCHELAHAIANRRYGYGIREHGPEWSEYMEKAGFTPRPVIAAGEITGLPRLN